MKDQDAVSEAAAKRSSGRRSQVLDLDSIMVGIEEYLNNDDSDHEQKTDKHVDKAATDVPVNIVDGEQNEKGKNVIDLTGKDEDEDEDKGDGENRNDEKSFDDNDTLPTTQESLTQNKDHLNQFSAPSSNLSGETPISTQDHVHETTKDKDSQIPASIQGIEKGSDAPAEKSISGDDFTQKDLHERVASAEKSITNDDNKQKDQPAQAAPAEKSMLNDDHMQKDQHEQVASAEKSISSDDRTQKDQPAQAASAEKSIPSDEHIKKDQHAQAAPAEKSIPSDDRKQKDQHSQAAPAEKSIPSNDHMQKDLHGKAASVEKSIPSDGSKQNDQPAQAASAEKSIPSDDRTQKDQHEQVAPAEKSIPIDDRTQKGQHEHDDRMQNDLHAQAAPAEKSISSDDRMQNDQHVQDALTTKVEKPVKEQLASGKTEQTAGSMEEKCARKEVTKDEPIENIDEPTKVVEEEIKQHQKVRENSAEDSSYLKSTNNTEERTENREGSAKKNAEGDYMRKPAGSPKDLPETHARPFGNSGMSHTKETLEKSAVQYAPQNDIGPAEEKEPAEQSNKSISKRLQGEKDESNQSPSGPLDHQGPLTTHTNNSSRSNLTVSVGPKTDGNSDKYNDKSEQDVESDMSGQNNADTRLKTEEQERPEGASIVSNAHASNASNTEGSAECAVVGGDKDSKSASHIEGNEGGTVRPHVAREISTNEEDGSDAGNLSAATDANTTDDSDLHSERHSTSLTSGSTENAEKSAGKREAEYDNGIKDSNRNKDKLKDCQDNYEETNTIKTTEQKQHQKPPQITPPLQQEEEKQQAVSKIDAETEAILKGLDNPQELLKELEAERRKEPVFILTSLAGGGFHIIPRTNRLATILQANRIEFSYKDLGTDPQARNLWKAHAQGKQLPGLVRGSDVIGNWQDVEDANEEYRLEEILYSL
ncbi:ZYRO0E05522p [Zygosaccharomyces rouxii]|uniref:ZYRO0E05522p n=1 Tax=Zygosaccharomyces rouxii (strain ATCC 2623 / CBS 732 / NBRC 1130 / NCYC 568 / NRRL Y-229) TaxID=559307 RepID=C5E4F4_ZYGRC|nr:uncharacterized protein ZYRO0E05522g [Zygosaccharomyces rouxii]KAH9198227.1 hypothetical protein LQ764DRAFT_182386 [Zygosaccharomyces rouxii]CAR30915.1 ZYRO0E05522p [Zygosaccharomyces rouxii]